MASEITSFTGKYRDFSNFSRADIWPFWWPFSLPPFPGNEWAFHAWKEPDTGDAHRWIDIVDEIRTAPTPAKAKFLGSAKGIVHLRPNWNDIRIDVMRYLVQLKFRTHGDLRVLLVTTGDAELIEGNNWGDKFWGAVWDKELGWVGHNWLGKLLMEEREVLK